MEYHMCIILHALCVPVVGFLVMGRKNFTVSFNFLYLISSFFCNKNFSPKQNFAASRRLGSTKQEKIARVTLVRIYGLVSGRCCRLPKLATQICIQILL
jgi:hypothetical protein